MATTAPAAADTMVPFPTLDLLLLTFNCAKARIHVPDFAAHLQRALSDHGSSGSAASPSRNGTSALPDLVVFSLQEVAPLGHAFVGSYFMSPYLARFDEALSLAAAQVDGHRFEGGAASEDSDGSSPSGDGDASEDPAQRVSGETARAAPTTRAQSQSQSRSQGRPGRLRRGHRGPKKHYHLVQQAHVGMTAILMFARDPAAIHDVQVAHCGFGVADMGNKGAVGLRIAYGEAASRSELTFVATHLAAMEWNVRRRNANWRSIVAGLTFGDPRDVIAAAATTSEAASALGRGPLGRSHNEAASAPPTPEEEAETETAGAAGDDAWLLLGQDQKEIEVRRQLQDLSVFRPDSLLFVAGDLNYRIGDKRPPADAALPTATTWRAFLERDQLTEERLAGRTFHGMQEAPIAFPPTYKYDILSAEDLASGAVPENADAIQQWQAAHGGDGGDGGDGLAQLPPVPYKYATHRWPSWCDRVLYLDVPAWTKERWARSEGGSGSGSGSGSGHKGAAPGAVVPAVQATSYQALPLMSTSDHQPVYLRATVPLLGPSAGRPEEDAAEAVAEAASGAGRSQSAVVDPRLRLPVAIDTDAWARRARARNQERLAGCGMLLFNTREGAAAMATTVVVVVGLYWIWVGLL